MNIFSRITNYINAKDKYIIFFYSYMFLIPWNFFKWQFSVLTIILFIWCCIKFRFQIKDRVLELIKFKPLIILIIFIFYTYISILWSDSINDGYSHVSSFHKYYIFIILALFISIKAEQAMKGIKVLVISFCIYAMFSLVLSLDIINFSFLNKEIRNQNGILAYAIGSMYMTIGAIFGLFIYLFSKNKITQYSFLLISIICFISLFISKSRTAQLSFLFVSLLLILIYFRKNIFKFKNLIIIIILASTVLFSSFFVLKESGKIDRYYLAYTESKEAILHNKFEGSFSLRLYFNIVGLKLFEEEPIFGSGPEDNVNYLINYQKNDPNYTINNIYDSYHSQHIDFLTRYGLVGYLLIVCSTIYLIYLLKDNSQVYYLALSFFLLVFFSSFSNVMLTKKPFNYIYITLFVLFSIIALKKQKE